MTSNPLRIGEPARGFFAQTHIWNKQPDGSNPEELKAFLKSKELQNIAMCLEDINHLIELIKILPQASDYTNKLLGKFIILEMHNILSCFNNLANVSSDFKSLRQQLTKELRKLDRKYKFRDIRNVITAHKHYDKYATLNLSLKEQVDLWNLITSESLNAYLKTIQKFILKLHELAPLEYRSYFLTNNSTLNGIACPGCGDEYTPFYEETRNWKPEDE